MIEGQLGHHGQADGLGLQRHPGPEVVVTPTGPPNAAPMAAPTAGDLVLGLEGGHAEALVPDSSWRMSEAGVIG